VYKEVNTFKRGFVPRTSFIRREKGKIVSDPMGIKNRWREYFNRLLNPTEQETEVPEGNQRSGRDVDDGTEEIEPSTDAEGHEAIRSLKNNKAPGIGELPAELFKGGERIAMGWTCTPDAELQNLKKKKSMEGGILGGRPVRRPRRRWIDAVCQDAREQLGVKRWEAGS
jgi:hypothetical protein